jgi:hypothetical protein
MKQKYFFIFLILLFSNSGFASWEGTGIAVESQEKEVIQLKTSQGNKFEMIAQEPLTSDTVAKIKKMTELFFQFEKISISRLRFIVKKNALVEAYLPITKLIQDSVNLQSFFPAGLVFFYNESLNYDFRMHKNNIFLRLKGQFISEKELLSKVSQALDNPLAFLEKNSLESLKAKIEHQQNEFDILKKEFDYLRNSVLMLHNKGFLSGPKKIQSHKISRAILLKKQNPGWNTETIQEKMEAEKIDISEDEVALILAIYFNEF